MLCVCTPVSLRRAVVIVRHCTCQAIASMVTNLKYPGSIQIIQREITCLGAVACSNKYNPSGPLSSLSCLDAHIVCMSGGCELTHLRMCIYRQGLLGQHFEKNWQVKLVRSYRIDAYVQILFAATSSGPSSDVQINAPLQEILIHQ